MLRHVLLAVALPLFASFGSVMADDCWLIDPNVPCPVETFTCTAWCEPCTNDYRHRIVYPVEDCVLAGPGQGGRAFCNPKNVETEADQNLCYRDYYCSQGTILCPGFPNLKQCEQGASRAIFYRPKRILSGPVCFVEEG